MFNKIKNGKYIKAENATLLLVAKTFIKIAKILYK